MYYMQIIDPQEADVKSKDNWRLSHDLLLCSACCSIQGILDKN